MATVELVKAKHQVPANVIVHNDTVFTVEYVKYVEGQQTTDGQPLILIRARKAGSVQVYTFELEQDFHLQTLVV